MGGTSNETSGRMGGTGDGAASGNTMGRMSDAPCRMRHGVTKESMGDAATRAVTGETAKHGSDTENGGDLGTTGLSLSTPSIQMFDPGNGAVGRGGVGWVKDAACGARSGGAGGRTGNVGKRVITEGTTRTPGDAANDTTAGKAMVTEDLKGGEDWVACSMVAAP